MSYLYITFKDAKLHQSLTTFGTLDKKADNNANTEKIIGVEQVSNVLHILMGLPPIPSKRESRFKHNSEIFEVAKTAKIKYDNNYGVDQYGVFNGIEFGSAAKPAFNSHQKLTTKFKIDNKDEIIKGWWNWNSVRKFMFSGRKKNFEQWDIFYKFLCDYSNCEDLISKMSLYEFIKEISIDNFLKIKPFIKKLNEENLFEGCTDVYRLFNGDFKEINGNTSYSTQQPMLYNNGIRTYKPFSGKIVVEIPHHFEDLIRENEGYCTILDNGFVSIEMKNWGLNDYNGYEDI